MLLALPTKRSLAMLLEVMSPFCRSAKKQDMQVNFFLRSASALGKWHSCVAGVTVILPRLQTGLMLREKVRFTGWKGCPASMEGPCSLSEGLMGPLWGIHGTVFGQPLRFWDTLTVCLLFPLNNYFAFLLI